MLSPVTVRDFLHKELTLRVKHVFHALAMAVASVSGTGAAANAPPPAPVADTAATPGPVLPTLIGINLTIPSYYAQVRAFANLAVGGGWRLSGGAKAWSEFPRDLVLPDGGIAGLPPGSGAVRMLTPPVHSLSARGASARGIDIRCTWQGGGQMGVQGGATNALARANQLDFHMADWHKNVWLQVLSVNHGQSITHIDCREAGVAADAVFDPAFVRDLSEYKVLRFMDWQRINANAPVTWATRTLPSSIEYNRADGVPIEDMVALAKLTGAAPWFCMPWNASQDYITNFARYVHDNLPAGQSVYVEVGNEIWNGQFSAARQATAEGMAAGLGVDAWHSDLFRLAERTVEVMKIWEQVFADNPRRLVRVISTQHVNTSAAKQVLAYRDTAAHIDALATAPYFGYDLMKEGQTTDLKEIFSRLNERVDQTIDIAYANRAVAAKYGKRYIAYEAGQHVVMPQNVPLSMLVQRDPRMYDVYRHYISAWRQKIGDTLTLFSNVGPISNFGGWGLAEYSGQPISETPKLRAVMEQLDHQPGSRF